MQHVVPKARKKLGNKIDRQIYNHGHIFNLNEFNKELHLYVFVDLITNLPKTKFEPVEISGDLSLILLIYARELELSEAMSWRHFMKHLNQSPSNFR